MYWVMMCSTQLAACRLVATADLVPGHKAAQDAFGQVIGRLVARHVDEGPQRLAQTQDVPA